jgi:hypothetical protein
MSCSQRWQWQRQQWQRQKSKETTSKPTPSLAVPLPRVVDRPPVPASPLPRVPITPAKADCHIRGVGESVQIVGMASQVAVPPTQFVARSQLHTSENVTPQRGTHGPALPSREVHRLWGRSHPQLILPARQPAIPSSDAEGNRSRHVSTLVIASSTLAKILKGQQADGHST